MNTKRVKVYVHRSKESNIDLAQELGLGVGSKAEGQLLYLGSEEELIYDIDVKTGQSKLVGAGGKYLGDESVTSGDLDL